MAIENEFNYVLRDDDGDLRRGLEADRTVTKQRILQGWLAKGLRLRMIEDMDTRVVERVLSFKMEVRGELVEVETFVDADDFDRLWTKRNETLLKYRYKFADGERHWDVDYMGTRKTHYFVKAECEAPEDVKDAPEIHPRLEDSLVYAAGKEKGFSSRRLSDQKYARKLIERLVDEMSSHSLAA